MKRTDRYDSLDHVPDIRAEGLSRSLASLVVLVEGDETAPLHRPVIGNQPSFVFLPFTFTAS
jgi:hypothetical protein